MVKSAIKFDHVKDYLAKAQDARANKDSVIAEDHPADTSSANTTDIQKGDNPLDTINKADFLASDEFKELMKAQVTEAVAKAAADAKAEAEAAAQIEIDKANAAAEELRKAEQARIEEDYTAVIKSYGYVEEDKVEALVKHLIENKEVAETIVAAFTKASDDVEAVKKEFGQEIGADVQNQEEVAKTASDMIRLKAAQLKKAQK